jgi:hypothetical protein
MSDEFSAETIDKAVRANILLFVLLGIPGAMITIWSLSLVGAGTTKILLGFVGCILLSLGLTGLIRSFQLMRAKKVAE